MKRATLIALGVGLFIVRAIIDFQDLRATHLELFDGAAASASVAICLDEYAREGWL